MTKQDAARLVETFAAGYSVRASLNDKGLGGMEINDALIYFEHDEKQQSFKVSALIYRFDDAPRPGILEGFRAEAEQGTDTGGGKVDYEPENKGLFLAKTYQIVPMTEQFESDLRKLMSASQVWGDEVLERVASKVFKN